MYTMDVDTLATIQRERYNDFIRQAELLRLLRVQKETSDPTRPAVQPKWLTALQQMVWTALQTHVRALPPR